jgi:uncharacterized protein YuzB (UPF0349 family)
MLHDSNLAKFADPRALARIEHENRMDSYERINNYQCISRINTCKNPAVLAAINQDC